MGGGAETEGARRSETAAGDDGTVPPQRAGQLTDGPAGKLSRRSIIYEQNLIGLWLLQCLNQIY